MGSIIVPSGSLSDESDAFISFFGARSNVLMDPAEGKKIDRRRRWIQTTS